MCFLNVVSSASVADHQYGSPLFLFIVINAFPPVWGKTHAMSLWLNSGKQILTKMEGFFLLVVYFGISIFRKLKYILPKPNRNVLFSSSSMSSLCFQTRLDVAPAQPG